MVLFWPINKSLNTPQTLEVLIWKNKKVFVVVFPVNHRPMIPLVRLPEYYQGKISRGEAQELLQRSGFYEGQFLLRKSSTCFVLSVSDKGQVYHYQIQKKVKERFILFFD